MVINRTTGSRTSATRSWLLVGAMSLAALTAVLNSTTVTSTLEAVGVELGAPISGVVWVITSYIVGVAISVPLMGWLSDRFGLGFVLRLGLVGFLLSSLVCGFAWDLTSMIVFRVVQGVAGGLLEPASLAVVGAAIPKARLGRAMGFVSLGINVGPIVGPLLGAALVGIDAWRWLFWISIPLDLVVVAVAWRLVPVGLGVASTQRASIDGVGLALLPTGFVLVLLAFNRLGAGGEPVLVVALAAIGVVLLAAYSRHALRVPAPLLDIRLLRNPAFAAAATVMSLVGLVMYTQISMLPILAVRDLGLASSPTLPVALLGLGLLPSMTLAGNASDRVGPRVLVVGGAIVTGVAALGIVVGLAAWPTWLLLTLLVILGLGFGAVASPAFTSVYRVLPAASVAQGTSALFIIVNLSASAGVTVVGFLTGTAEHPGTAAYLVIAAGAVGMLVASRWLPGRPGDRADS